MRRAIVESSTRRQRRELDGLELLPVMMSSRSLAQQSHWGFTPLGYDATDGVLEVPGERSAVTFAEKIVEPRSCTCCDVDVAGASRKRNHGRGTPDRVAAHFMGERKTVHPRHVYVADDQIEDLPIVAELECVRAV